MWRSRKLHLCLSGRSGNHHRRAASLRRHNHRRPMVASTSAIGQPRIEGQTPAQAARQIASHLACRATKCRRAWPNSGANTRFSLAKSTGCNGRCPTRVRKRCSICCSESAVSSGGGPGRCLRHPAAHRRWAAAGDFRVDLNAIVLKQDDRPTTLAAVRSNPCRRDTASALEKYIPPWLRPVYQFFVGTRPERKEKRERGAPPGE